MLIFGTMMNHVNYSLVGCELVKEYYDKGLKRLQDEQAQMVLF
ncbi:MAG TPA: hypothetical protein PLY25_07225 [Bacteroidia bacterium]|nr:hypothetical protein [Bacteroidia bacterium]